MTDPLKDRDLGELIRRYDRRFESPEAREQFFAFLVRVVNSPDCHTRIDAAFPIGWYLPDPDGRAEGLIRILIDDHDDQVRFAAAQAAIRHGSERFKEELAPQIVPCLLDAVRNAQGLYRTKLISSLGKFPSCATAILPTLIEALGSEDPRERYCATSALGRFGVAAAPATETIRQAIERETECWTTTEGTIDLRRVHARNLFRVIGDNAWSRAVVAERLGNPEVPENIRRGAQWLLRELDGLEPTDGRKKSSISRR